MKCRGSQPTAVKTFLVCRLDKDGVLKRTLISVGRCRLPDGFRLECFAMGSSYHHVLAIIYSDRIPSGDIFKGADSFRVK